MALELGIAPAADEAEVGRALPALVRDAGRADPPRPGRGGVDDRRRAFTAMYELPFGVTGTFQPPAGPGSVVTVDGREIPGPVTLGGGHAPGDRDRGGDPQPGATELAVRRCLR